MDQLMQGGKSPSPANEKVQETVAMIFRGIALAMGISVTVLMIMDQLDVRSGIIMLGIGLASAALSLLRD